MSETTEMTYAEWLEASQDSTRYVVARSYADSVPGTEQAHIITALLVAIRGRDREIGRLQGEDDEAHRDTAKMAREEERARIVEGACIDVESLPIEWAEWDALDGEEKGATLEDFFLIASRLANTPERIIERRGRGVV